MDNKNLSQSVNKPYFQPYRPPSTASNKQTQPTANQQNQPASSQAKPIPQQQPASQQPPASSPKKTPLPQQPAPAPQTNPPFPLKKPTPAAIKKQPPAKPQQPATTPPASQFSSPLVKPSPSPIKKQPLNQPKTPPVPLSPVKPPPAPVQPAATGAGSFTQKEVGSFSLMRFLKLAYLVGFFGLFITGAVFLSRKFLRSPAQQVILGGEGEGKSLLETPYQPVVWKDFGQVFEPILKIPIVYAEKGAKEEEFLLDSGAVVSSLPREKAPDLGYNSLAKLPRSTFGGFGGTTSFAYRGKMTIQIGEKEVTIPVVFTEAKGTKMILGRSGFFENYSINFNAKREVIEVSQ